MAQPTQQLPHGVAGPDLPSARTTERPDDGLTDELRAELRAMIARRASLYRELEKH